MVRLAASIPVYVSDLLRPVRGLAPAQPPTRFTGSYAALRPLVNAHARSKSFREHALPYVLYRYQPPTARGSGLLGALFARRPAPVLVRLVSAAPAWRGGVCWWDLVWDVPGVPRDALDLAQVRDSVAGGVTDGWGEGAEQIDRFGELCALDHNDVYRPARGADDTRGLTAGEDGRYALLLTLKGAKFKALDEPRAATGGPQPRPSPSASAAQMPVGTRRRGNDGRMWAVASTRAGVRRWVAAQA